MSDLTRRFDLSDMKEWETREILTEVYNSLQQKGYNPINQIVGYILSEDPTYITNFNNARTLIRQLDRDELLQELVRYYLNLWECDQFVNFLSLVAFYTTSFFSEGRFLFLFPRFSPPNGTLSRR